MLCYGVIVSEQICGALKQSRCPLSSPPASSMLSCTVRLRNDKSKASRRIRALSCVFHETGINLGLLLDLDSSEELSERISDFCRTCSREKKKKQYAEAGQI